MKLYDTIIEKTLHLLSPYQSKALKLESNWPNSTDKIFIFPEDGEVELGATSFPSSYLISYTSSPTLIPEDEILLIGKDIKDLKGNSPFARIVFIQLEDCIHSEQEAYRILRNIEYQRYKVNPEGYMIRVNTNQIREGARIDKEAIKKGLSFKDIGSLFLKAYKKESRVIHVKQIFITDPSFDYESLAKLSSSNEGITVALDHILKNLKMDCNTCDFKDICDEIEGMRDVHKRSEYKM